MAVELVMFAGGCVWLLVLSGSCCSLQAENIRNKFRLKLLHRLYYGTVQTFKQQQQNHSHTDVFPV